MSQPAEKKLKTMSTASDEVTDAVVIVTGGTTGIGRACADLFAERGARVYNIDIQALDHPKITTKVTDVSNVEQLQASIAEIVKETDGRIDYLISSAGVHLFADIEGTTPQQFDRVVGINIRGTFFAIQTVLPFMKKQGGGSIVTIGSDQTFIGKPDSAVYGLTKGAIGQLTKSTAVQYAGAGIRCNAVCPGTIETPLYHNAVQLFSKISGVPAENLYDGLAKAQPINRVGQPSEVAQMVLAVATSRFMTGSLVALDGGYTAQ